MVASKVNIIMFAQLINKRLIEEVERTGGLANELYGFREKKSQP